MLHTKLRGNPMKKIYGHGGHHGHVTSITSTIFHFHVPKKFTYKIWLKTPKWFLRKACLIFIHKWPWAKVKI